MMMTHHRNHHTVLPRVIYSRLTLIPKTMVMLTVVLICLLVVADGGEAMVFALRRHELARLAPNIYVTEFRCNNNVVAPALVILTLWNGTRGGDTVNTNAPFEYRRYIGTRPPLAGVCHAFTAAIASDAMTCCSTLMPPPVAVTDANRRVHVACADDEALSAFRRAAGAWHDALDGRTLVAHEIQHAPCTTAAIARDGVHTVVFGTIDATGLFGGVDTQRVIAASILYLDDDDTSAPSTGCQRGCHVAEWDQIYNVGDFDFGDVTRMSHELAQRHIDLEATMTHECGHCAGVGHADGARCVDATMYATVNTGDASPRSLHRYDRHCVRHLHGMSNRAVAAAAASSTWVGIFFSLLVLSLTMCI